MKILRTAPIVLLLIIELMTTAPLFSLDNENDQFQIMGKIQNFKKQIIIVDGMRLVIHKNTIMYSQAHDQIPLSKLNNGQLVDVSYHRSGKFNVVDKIKLLDLVGTGNYKTFNGKINGVARDKIRIGNIEFLLDDFTIKLGSQLQKSNLMRWQNMNVTVIALKNDQGEWIAEIIREAKIGRTVRSAYMLAE